MLTPTEAARLILEHIAPLPAARRPLREALDRVLAEDVTSPIDLPAWDNSAMDGYAARAADVEGAGPDRKITLAVVEAVAAGRFPTKPIGPPSHTHLHRSPIAGRRRHRRTARGHRARGARARHRGKRPGRPEEHPLPRRGHPER